MPQLSHPNPTLPAVPIGRPDVFDRPLRIPRGDGEALGYGTCEEAAIPHGHDEIRNADLQGAGKVYGVGTAQVSAFSQMPGGYRHTSCQLDRPQSHPEPLPSLAARCQFVFVHVVAATRGC